MADRPPSETGSATDPLAPDCHNSADAGLGGALPSHAPAAARWVRLHSRAPVLGIFALAAVLRLWLLTRPGLGDDFDLGLFVGWMRQMNESGFAGFYSSGMFGDYPPVMMVLFRAVGEIVGFVVESPSDHAFRVGIKSLTCGFEMGIGGLLLLEGRNLLGPRAGLVAAALFLFNPAALYESGYWGQVDAIPTAFLLGSLMLVRRRFWARAGLVAALALTAKFQAVVLLPLLIFEAFRLTGFRGLTRLAAGGVIGLLIAIAPFFLTGTLEEIVDRAYINVVGQYPKMSNNAYNVWYVWGDPGMPNTSPPQSLIEAVAQGAPVVTESASFLLDWTWRKISIVLFAISVAVVLALYSIRPGPVARYVAAGLLFLCFYLFPTEMHERYAYPALALLAPWAAVGGLQERVYWAFSTLLLLNLAAVLPIEPLAPHLAVINLALFTGILLALHRMEGAASSEFPLRGETPASPPGPLDRDAPRRPGEAAVSARSVVPEEEPGPRWTRPILRGFRFGTATAVLCAVVAGLWIQVRANSAPPIEHGPGHVAWLSERTPLSAEQGWGELGVDASVSGGPLRIGAEFFLRGIGTHAPARLTYEIPEDADWFETTVGIDLAGQAHGSAEIRIEVDGQRVYASPRLIADAGGRAVRTSVTGGGTLTIHVDPTRDGQRSDHVDLALARFTRQP